MKISSANKRVSIAYREHGQCLIYAVQIQLKVLPWQPPTRTVTFNRAIPGRSPRTARTREVLGTAPPSSYCALQVFFQEPGHVIMYFGYCMGVGPYRIHTALKTMLALFGAVPTCHVNGE